MAAVAMSPPSDTDVKVEIKPALTPPTSEEADKNDESGSDLSDLEPECDDIGEIVPDHYYEGGKVPVFKPTTDQFRSFKKFIQKIDKYGMKSGIVKVIPPKEWRDSLPALDDQVKTIKVKNPITQEFHGTHGTYTQANIEKQRSYNLPQWKALSEESNHQPPARRGERRRNQEKATRSGATRTRNGSTPASNGRKRGPGRPRVRPVPTSSSNQDDAHDESNANVDVPPTPTSPSTPLINPKKEELSEDEEMLLGKSKGHQPKSVSSRRKHNRRDQADVVDEAAFKGFNYRVNNQEEWTTERCQELETAYWKGLTFNNPMYGADMPGSLFDDSTESWNVAKLENLLDVLGQKVPGVNTAYLYLGMWKATFAWHLEDVDLYSINYIHFGAPKQWYSISQEDARRFEAAMRSIWPNDAKNCDQFLRHKTYLISPSLLQSQYNIRVNRLVHYEGEFVITFPYGYHSGYNLGYNCAESVNFATESWLDYGRVARKCNCEADSVWVDVGDIERKLRGEQTPEYYEETEEEEDEDDEDEGPTDLPTPPGSDKGKPRVRNPKRKRDAVAKDGKPKVKRLRIKIKAPTKEPCVLCPNDNAFEDLLPTDNGHKAHRRCALYTPETYIAQDNGTEKVFDVARINKARLELKCNYCRNKRGSVFQCCQMKCTRAYHATCAAAAGVQVDVGIAPVFVDGTEYTDTCIDFRCRFHRIKRPKQADGTSLEDNALIRKHAMKLSVGDVVQLQYYQGDIFAGFVLENRKSEQMLLVEVFPNGDKLEVEYKWLLVFDPTNSQLAIPSENAKPLPAHLARKSQTISEKSSSDSPKADEPFCDPKSQHKWSEFHTAKFPPNPAQVKIDLSRPKQLWFYLGKTSTEAKAQYTGNLANKQNDLEANFLESVRPAVPAATSAPRRPYPASYPTGVNMHAMNAARANAHIQKARPQEKPYTGKYAITNSKPYEYKPRNSYQIDAEALRNQRAFQQATSITHAVPHVSLHTYRPLQAQISPAAPMAPMAPMMSSTQHRPSYSHTLGADEQRQWTQLNAPQSHNQRKIQPQTQAPVANMMGSSTASRHNSFSRPTSSETPTPTLGTPTSHIRKSSITLDALAKYPYLDNAHRVRPPVYQSPYAPGGGFTITWMPNPVTPQQATPRGVGLSEEFLMKRSPSQQEHVKTHIRKMSADKALQQQQSLQRPQGHHTQQQQQQQQRAAMSPPSTSQHHMLNTQAPTQKYQRQPSYTQTHSFEPQYSPHSFSNPLQQRLYRDPFPNIQPGLQFQSPQDFQTQMRREAEAGDWAKGQSGYDRLFKDLQNVGAQPGGNSNTSQMASPLKGMMGGGEMLPPMMSSNNDEV